MGKVGMNSKLLISIVTIIGIGIFSTIVFTMFENNSSLGEQQLQELIQNEISKSPQITGIHAQTICKILDTDCSDQTSFYAVFDSMDGYTKFRHMTPNGVHYDFRIIDDMLEYKTNHNPTEWMIFGDDSWMWEDDAKAKGETVNNENSSMPKYPRTYHYESDNLGNYEQWCSDSQGFFLKDSLGSVTCEFNDPLVYEKSRDLLHEMEKKKISGELAQKLCRAYGKECQPGIFITMDYNMETGELSKKKRDADPSSGHYYTEYRIIDGDVIQYRYPTYPASPWNTFED